MSFTVDELPVPDTLDGPGGAAFAELGAVSNAVEGHALGTDLLSMGLQEMLAEYTSTPTRLRRHLVVREDGAMIGRAMITSRPLTPETGAYLMVDVLPAQRRRGVGIALLAAAEELATSAGAPVLKVGVVHSATPGGLRVVPPTGFGELSADDAGARFLSAHGYALEQVVRISLLDVPGVREQVRRLGDGAVARARDDYGLHTWVGPTPARWVDELAALRTRMSTDAPSAGMVMVLDPWDAERVREHDARIASSGRTMLTSAAEHRATGTLAGFSEIVVSDDGAVAVQEDTLVLGDHRGRRLGLLLKTANVEQLAATAPHVEAIVTWNAEENRPMLDVNEAMGFRAIGLEGGWQKRV